MKFLAVLAACVTALSVEPRANPSGSSIAHPKHDGKGYEDSWGCNSPDHRRTVTIRPSKSDTDDISEDFLWAMKKANNGGTLWLKKGETYVIGKKLDLSFLNDIHVRLDGEIKFTNDIDYWQAK